jgi:hypothetical protein
MHAEEGPMELAAEIYEINEINEIGDEIRVRFVADPHEAS